MRIHWLAFLLIFLLECVFRDTQMCMYSALPISDHKQNSILRQTGDRDAAVYETATKTIELPPPVLPLSKTHPPNSMALAGSFRDQSLSRYVSLPLVAHREFLLHPKNCNSASCINSLSTTCGTQAKEVKILTNELISTEESCETSYRDDMANALQKKGLRVCRSSPAGNTRRACVELQPRGEWDQFIWYLL